MYEYLNLAISLLPKNKKNTFGRKIEIAQNT